MTFIRSPSYKTRTSDNPYIPKRNGAMLFNVKAMMIIRTKRVKGIDILAITIDKYSPGILSDYLKYENVLSSQSCQTLSGSLNSSPR